MLDWELVRAELARYRRAAQLTETELAERLAISRSTVYRIEDTVGLPDHKPDLETIEAWLQATGAPRLGRFFADLEQVKNSSASLSSSVNDRARIHNGPISATEPAHARERSPFSTPDGAALAELVAFVTDLSVALANAVARARERAADGGPPLKAQPAQADRGPGRA